MSIPHIIIKKTAGRASLNMLSRSLAYFTTYHLRLQLALVVS